MSHERLPRTVATATTTTSTPTGPSGSSKISGFRSDRQTLGHKKIVVLVERDNRFSAIVILVERDHRCSILEHDHGTVVPMHWLERDIAAASRAASSNKKIVVTGPLPQTFNATPRENGSSVFCIFTPFLQGGDSGSVRFERPTTTVPLGNRPLMALDSKRTETR